MLNLIRSKRVGIVAVLLIWAMVLIAVSVVGQSPGVDKPPDAYEFPVEPGSTEWAEKWEEYKSYGKMVEMSQVPESVLQEMSTEGLIETCLNYPFYGNVMFFNSPQQGFDDVASQFNGLQELLKREDVGTQLLARYRRMDPSAIGKGWTSSQRGKYSRDFTYIELLLAQDAVLSSMTQAERHELLAEGLQKFRAKRARASFGYSALESSALMMGRILQNENVDAFNQKVQENESLQTFLESGMAMNGEDLKEVLSQVEQFLGK